MSRREKEMLNPLQQSIQEGQVDLSNLTDAQKLVLAEISYLDFTEEGLQKIKNGGLKISELEDYLKYPNDMSSGYPLGTKELNEKVMGEMDALDTDLVLWQRVNEAGLGDIVLTDFTMDSKTGFCAMSFSDQAGNTGISYRGSDFDYANGAAWDWLRADIGEHFTSTSTQAQQASEYFREHCGENGQNYIYGYSLGGNLVAHTFRDNHGMIAEAFSYNGSAISQKLLDSQEIVDAFNSNKFNCCINAGDLASLLKENDLYRDNIRVIENKNGISSDFIGAHSPSAAKIGEYGNFIEMPYEEMEQRLGEALGSVGTKALHLVRGQENAVYDWMHPMPNNIVDFAIRSCFGHDAVPASMSKEDLNKAFESIGNAMEQRAQAVSNSGELIAQRCKIGIGEFTQDVKDFAAGHINEFVSSGDFFAFTTDRNVFSGNFDAQQVLERLGSSLNINMQEWGERVRNGIDSLRDRFGEITQQADIDLEKLFDNEISLDSIIGNNDSREIDIDQIFAGCPNILEMLDRDDVSGHEVTGQDDFTIDLER